jgi:hypothetical protein
MGVNAIIPYSKIIFFHTTGGNGSVLNMNTYQKQYHLNECDHHFIVFVATILGYAEISL